MNNFFDVSGRTALVTGGSRGLGRMIAEAYVQRGVRTYITARHADVCEQTAKELSEFGECIAIQNDQGSIEGVHALADEIKSREETLDVLVNNAGTGWHEEFEKFPEAGWDKTFDLNIKSVFFLTQQLTPLLRAAASPAKPAKVINISSTDALWIPEDEAYPYPASKAGLLHLTRKTCLQARARAHSRQCDCPGRVCEQYERHGSRQSPGDGQIHPCGPRGRTRGYWRNGGLHAVTRRRLPCRHNHHPRRGRGLGNNQSADSRMNGRIQTRARTHSNVDPVA